MAKEKNFLKEAAILGAAGIVIKILGAVFKIPLANLLGDEGMSYFQSAYPIYIYIMIASSAGLPTAIAKMVSKRETKNDYLGIRQVFKVAFYILSTIGAIFFALVFFNAEKIVALAGNDPEAVYALRAIAPAIFLVSMMSCFRGFFQGLQNLKPYAISQIIEQIFRVVFGLGLVVFFLDDSLALAAAGGTFGAAIGGFFGLVFMVIYYLKIRKDVFDYKNLGTSDTESNWFILKRLFQIAVPITIGASVIPMMNLIDLFLVIKRLKSIGIIEQANNLYGQLTGYANTLINLPAVLTASVQISLVPAVTQLKLANIKKMKYTIKAGMRIAILIGLPASIGLSVMSYEIMSLLYFSQPEILNSISSILNVLGFGVIFLSTYQVTTGILQGLDKQYIPVRNLFIGALLKIILAYILVGIPSLNILGAAIATVVAYATGAILNVISVVKYSNIDLNIKEIFFKPLLAALTMGVVAKISFKILSLFIMIKISTVLSIVIAAFIYLILLFRFDIIKDRDLDFVPAGDKLKIIREKLI